MARKVSTADVEELKLLQGENEELKAALKAMTERCNRFEEHYDECLGIIRELSHERNKALNEITELNKHLGFYQNRNLWQRIINKKYGE